MWTLKDQIEVYILKYKEQLFKLSENTRVNQDLIDRLRGYFDEASTQGELKLKAAYEKLTSPNELARRHLKEKGVKFPKKSSVLAYMVIFIGVLITCILLFSATAYFWLFPSIQKKLDEGGFDYSFYFEEKHFGALDGEEELVKGRVPDVAGKRLIIEGKNISLEFKNHEQTYLSYECKTNKEDRLSSREIISLEGDNLLFQISDGNKNIDCKFLVPGSLKKNISAKNLNLELDLIKSDLNISAKNAMITLDVDESLAYDLDLRAENSLVMNRSLVKDDPEGIHMFIDVKNGKVSFE